MASLRAHPTRLGWALLACALAALPAAARPPARAALAVLQRHECNRCHDVEGLPAPEPAKDCAGCHRRLGAAAGDEKRLAEGRAEFGAAFDRFVHRAGGRYVHLPPLASMERFRASWLQAFLLSPYDVRPNLEESMLRSALTADEVQVLVRGWGAQPDAPAPQAAPPARIAEGARLFDEKGCAACHLFGNRPSPAAAGLEASLQPRLRHRALAPDLRHARDRLARQTVLALLEAPRKVNARAEMPRPSLTAKEREAVADFLLFGQPGEPAPPATVTLPAYDARAPVPSWEEVEDKVFRHVCWHCHSNAEFADDDGGPGNSGGFGFAPAGLSLATFRELKAGSLDERGQRQSVFRPGPSGEPVLLERVRRRYLENQRDFVAPLRSTLEGAAGAPADGPRGMPLGLPALSLEQLSLLERWVKGGRPAPLRPSGDGSPMRVR